MIILIAQLIIAAFGFLSLWFEVSEKYRDCELNVAIRYTFILASILVAFRMSVFYAAPFLLQVGVLFLTVVSATFLYKKVLKKQIRIKNYKLYKLYLGEVNAKRLNR